MKTLLRNKYIISTILMLSLITLISAGTTISNNPSSYLTSDNLTINNSGFFGLNGYKLFTKGVEVIVSKGLNSNDDQNKIKTSDFVCLSTATECNTTIQNAVNSLNGNRGIISLTNGTYYFGGYIDLPSYITIDCNGATLVTNGTESLWNDGGLKRGLFQINNIKQNVKIQNCNFILNGIATGIKSYSSNNLQIFNNYFIGNTTGGSNGGAIFLDATNGDITNSVISYNTFYNLTYANVPLKMDAQSGKTIFNTEISHNSFNENNQYNIYINSHLNGLIRYTNVLYNNFNNTHNNPGTSSYASAIIAGDANAYTVDELNIIGNHYYNMNINSTDRASFAMVYAMNNVVISDNIAKVKVPNGDGMFIAPGRVDWPLYHAKIFNNYEEGFYSFFDPDSMSDVEVYGNTIMNNSENFVIGYGIQNYYRFHDNIIYNSFYRATPDRNGGLMFFSTPAGNGSSVYNNLFIDESINPTVNCSIRLALNGDYSNILLKNNRFFSNGTYYNLPMCNNTAIIAFPTTEGNDFIVDNINKNNSGNITASYFIGDGSALTNINSNNINLSNYYNNTQVYKKSENLMDNLVLDLPFDNGNNHLTDYSRNGVIITRVNSTWNSTGGHNGFGAFNFSTQPSYLTTNNKFISSNFTWCAWFKLITLSSPGTQNIMNNQGGSLGAVLRYTSANGLEWYVSDGSSSPDLKIGAVSINTWYFVCGVYGNNVSKIYLNGNMTKNSSIISTVLFTPDNNFAVSSSGNFNLNGTIDDTRIWNRSLSDYEILQVYNLKTNEQVFQNDSIDLTPISNIIYSLGNSVFRWLKLWVQDIDASGNITMSQNQTICMSSDCVYNLRFNGTCIKSSGSGNCV